MHVVPGQPAAPSQVADAAGVTGGSRRRASRSTPMNRGATRCRSRARRAPLQLATPVSETLPNGLTLILNERRGLPIVAANLVLRTGSDANPLDKPGLANFAAAMLDEGTSTRNALQIADEVAQPWRVAWHQQLDGRDDTVGALAVEELRGHRGSAC